MNTVTDLVWMRSMTDHVSAYHIMCALEKISVVFPIPNILGVSRWPHFHANRPVKSVKREVYMYAKSVIMVTN